MCYYVLWHCSCIFTKLVQSGRCIKILAKFDHWIHAARLYFPEMVQYSIFQYPHFKIQRSLDYVQYQHQAKLEIRESTYQQGSGSSTIRRRSRYNYNLMEAVEIIGSSKTRNGLPICNQYPGLACQTNMGTRL
ncbi:unnamed protein product [Hymenolepis diminuta]|uniref:Ovule protein n=1 Tax=Hymenolepis diminuta TaxID=6216 RepID=A0A158QGE1_HYMDI|nr:unnamed protein product [Hymenolepis diminuta]